MKRIILATLVIFIMFAAFAYLFPWKNVNWGKFQIEQANIVIVSGYAESDKGNQMASFNVTVSAIDSDKNTAVEKVNTGITDIATKIKSFGVPSDDIKTQSMSIYQNQEQYYDSKAGGNKNRYTDWNASNSIEIKYHFTDKTKIDELSKLLATSGANNVYGPNFSVDNKNIMETQKTLLDAAIKDAQSKAEAIAKSSGRSLGRIVSVTEGSSMSGGPIMFEKGMAGMGGGGNGIAEPGTSNINQTVTVVFELN